MREDLITDQFKTPDADEDEVMSFEVPVETVGWQDDNDWKTEFGNTVVFVGFQPNDLEIDGDGIEEENDNIYQYSGDIASYEFSDHDEPHHD